MNEILSEHLAGLAGKARIGSAELEPTGSDGTVWRVLSGPTEMGQVALTLTSSPTPINFAGREGAMGLSLSSRLQPRGLVVWPAAPEVSATELAAALEGCRDVYWQACEQSWLDSLSALLVALREQRRELGSAIHKGPAQALTAARLELSMLGDRSGLGALHEALDDASEGLVGLVHGKLRGRSKGESLEEALRVEIDFQARWRDLPIATDAVTLPKTPLSQTLTRLWCLTGGRIQENGQETTFIMTETKK